MIVCHIDFETKNDRDLRKTGVHAYSESPYAGIYVLRCADGEGAVRALGERGIRVSARGPGIRIAPHYYNTPEEVDACLDACATLAAPPG